MSNSDDEIIDLAEESGENEEHDLSDEDLLIDDASDESGKSHEHAVRIQKRAAEFLTYIKQECVTTQVTIDNIVKGVDDLFRLYNQFLKARIFELSDSDFIQKKDIAELFSYINQQTIFEGVQTQYKLQRYQKAKWDALVPRKVVFAWKRVLPHGKVRQVPSQFAYYVDFLEQLESILQCEDILNCVDNPKAPSDEFRSALDGYIYHNHPVAQKHPNALGIILYLDDIKAGDSLSSFSNLGLRNFLWSLANIYPELRSSVRAIQLLALSKASDAKNVKNEPILQKFIHGINRLSSEEGVTFNIKGVPRVFHGFLLFIIGDYPALANIGGFKESAAFAWRFCRQCMVTQEEKSEKYEESQVVLRTDVMHKQQLDAMEGTSIVMEDETEATEQHEKPTVKYGINFRSPLLQVNHFQVTQCLPQDIMHLFLEGILETECRFLLDHAVSSRKISLKEVNLYLNDLPTERPSPIEPQHLKNGLRQTSSQILMLSVHLPFLLGKHCETDRLRNFILLLKVLSMCLCSVLKLDHVSLLKRMIKEYLVNFNLLTLANSLQNIIS
ncbi:Heat-inducible transcription repressor [Frankliniella fusca]|uniref:Heat-inducible transcription repressor n=1 Tax=Frankliniella fusca TaxID=407009 RepID=A0AAE1HNF3_9NEOP|nr:Heat-inducible transcription repressor [Frankliniella fusca]